MFLQRLALVWSALLAGCAAGAVSADSPAQSRVLVDAVRGRGVPVQLTFPRAGSACLARGNCRVAFLSPGYGLPHTGYSFLADPLAASGYLVVAIQSVLPDDPAFGNSGNIVADRMPLWRTGAANLAFVKTTLEAELPRYDWRHLVLIGHSNGGDFSAMALAQDSTLATTLVTLDHRRYPLPRSESVKWLSVRGSDFEADPGVLPTADESKEPGQCVRRIPSSRHNDMHDGGPAWLKAEIARVLLDYLQTGKCGV